MKAIQITHKGGPEVLQLQEIPTPVAAEGEVLIKVKAAGLNRSDIYSRTSNRYGSQDGPEIPGLEVSGTIAANGPGATRYTIGTAVCALVTGGGYAEYITVPEGQVLPVPEGLDIEAAASLPETVFTVWLNVFQVAGLRPGENLLVHGGSSGIGVTAIQLATALGSPFTRPQARKKNAGGANHLGAVRAVNYKTDDFEEAFKDVGIDVVLDMTGGDFTIKNIRLLREDGRIVFINSMRGSQSTIDIAAIMRKRLVLTGSMLKPRDQTFKAALAADVEKHVWPLVTSGKVRPPIHSVFPLAEAAKAQQLMESSEHKGKILLRVS